LPADWPDEADAHPDRRDDQLAARASAHPARAEPEFPSRQEAYVSLRIAEATERTTTTQQTAASEQAALEKWAKAAQEARWMWTEYQRRWPDQDGPHSSHPDDPQGSWRGNGDRSLGPIENRQVEASYHELERRERERLTPAMREIEGQDPGRHLVGLKDSVKGLDRTKEKVCDKMEEFGALAEQAISKVSDVIRYTFQYRQANYTTGIWADMGRLRDYGFDLLKISNSWRDSAEYRGVNSQWIDAETGQRFEVQFHTRISFEAKRLTHPAYERVRTQRADTFEELVLDAFQKKVAANVPSPPGASDIPDYP